MCISCVRYDAFLSREQCFSVQGSYADTASLLTCPSFLPRVLSLALGAGALVLL